MSINVLKRKSKRYLDPISGQGKNGFSLVGGHRNIGVVGPTNLGKSVTRTPFRGPNPMGHGTKNGKYPIVIQNSGSCCTNDPDIIKTTVKNTHGMIEKRFQGILHGAYREATPHEISLGKTPSFGWVQPMGAYGEYSQGTYVNKKSKQCAGNSTDYLCCCVDHGSDPTASPVTLDATFSLLPEPINWPPRDVESVFNISNITQFDMNLDNTVTYCANDMVSLNPPSSISLSLAVNNLNIFFRVNPDPIGQPLKWTGEGKLTASFTWKIFKKCCGDESWEQIDSYRSTPTASIDFSWDGRVGEGGKYTGIANTPLNVSFLPLKWNPSLNDGISLKNCCKHKVELDWSISTPQDGSFLITPTPATLDLLGGLTLSLRSFPIKWKHTNTGQGHAEILDINCCSTSCCNDHCKVQHIGGRAIAPTPYTKNTQQMPLSSSQYQRSLYMRKVKLPTSKNKEHFPMRIDQNKCRNNYLTWEEAKKDGALPPDWIPGKNK